MAAKNREEWLLRLTRALRPMFDDAGAPIPDELHISVGFPSTRALSRSRKRIGECWSPKDSIHHIFISPVLAEEDADHVLVHELIHAAVGHEAGHKGPFRRVAKALGLEGKMTATTCGEELRERLNALKERARLGPYPHQPLKADRAPKDKGRMLKITCACEPARILRVTRKVIDQGEINCGICGYQFEEE